MKEKTDAELAEWADWAEANERITTDSELKKSYGAIRQGADWILRYRAKTSTQIDTALDQLERVEKLRKQ